MIDKDFIEKWAPKYIYSSKYKYSEILDFVQKELQESKIISKETFEKIIRWKAERNLNNIAWTKFEIYIEAITDVLKLQGYKKVCRLVGLPGILLPNATTILHLIYPKEFPIVDIRTVKVLLYKTQKVDGKIVHYLDTRYKIDYYRYQLWGYYNFRTAINKIAISTKKGLREIDKALFAYDTENKIEL